MPKKKVSTAKERRRREQLINRCMVLLLILGMLVPLALSVFLLGRVRVLNGEVDALTTQIDGLREQITQQQQQLEEWMRQSELSGEGSAAVSQSSAEVQGTIDEISREEQADEKTDNDKEIQHKVYLTFDDGPSIYTEDILDILDRYGVKATFFVIGKESAAAREAISMIVDGGHTLGMHSYSHKYAQLYQSVESFADDFVKLQTYLYEVTGVECKYYRFPGGSSNTVSAIPMQEFIDYLASQEVQYYDWNISSEDADGKQLSVDALVKNCTENISNNETSMILLHDSADKGTTVEALPIIIENILAMEDTVILPITEETVPVQHNID